VAVGNDEDVSVAGGILYGGPVVLFADFVNEAV
jgi:hypothetical protein